MKKKKIEITRKKPITKVNDKTYKQNEWTESSLKINNSVEGETIETKVMRIVENSEPITDGAPLIYTERKDGVQGSYNVRTDKFDVAIDAMDIVAKTNTAKRMEAIKAKEESDTTESIQATQETEK